jgi:Transcriptional activator TraM
MEDKISETDSPDAEKKIEAIIRAIAVKHGIALGRNDPILVLHTLNELLIQDLAKNQNELIYELRTNLEEAAYQFSKNLDSKKSDMLNVVKDKQFHHLREFKESIMEDNILTIADSLKEATINQQKRISLQLKAISSQLKFVRFLSLLSIAFTLVTLVFTVLLNFGMVFR